MQLSQYELSILVKDKPIREYHHEGSVFVEGRDGSEYKIRIKNNTYQQACLVVSVDGLSVLDGKECSDNSPGYLLKPYETLDIACYKVDAETGAKFVFGSKDTSYSAAIGKGTDNVGVIAARVFREKYVPPPLPVSSQPKLRSIGMSAGSYSTGASGGGAGLGGGGWFGSNSIQASNNASASNSTVEPTATLDSMPMPAPDEKLGTAFGDAMQWRTQTVFFNREPTPAASMMIFYDTKKNLERRGVKFEQKVPPLPNPFPGNETGCPVPDDWHK